MTNMKPKFTFLGKEFKVPAWATYIAADNNGEVWAYETKPVLNKMRPDSYTNPNSVGDATCVGYVEPRHEHAALRPMMKIDTRINVVFHGHAFKVPADAYYIAVDGDGEVNTFVRKPTRFEPYSGCDYWTPNGSDFARAVGKLTAKHTPNKMSSGRCVRIKDLLAQEAAANAEYEITDEGLAENPQVANLIAALHSGAIQASTLFQDIASPLAVGDLVQTLGSKRIDKIERIQGSKESPRYALETSCWYDAEDLILICRAAQLPK